MRESGNIAFHSVHVQMKEYMKDIYLDEEMF